VPNDVTDDMLLTVHGLRVRTYDMQLLILRILIPFLRY